MIKIISIKEKIKKENKRYITLTMFLLSALTMVIICSYWYNKNNGLTINGILMLENFKKDMIGVYMDGEVNNKGYIQIPKGKTLEYAINKANGITKEADIQNVDINRILINQEKIIIPKVNEEVKQGDDISIKNNDKININNANIEELIKLEGIGEKTAEKIIEYRKQKEFKNIEELTKIKGIGKGKFEKIKEKICT